MSHTQDFENIGPAARGCELRRHDGPLAKELFILCRPDSANGDILGQTASVYRSLYEALRQEAGSTEHVVQEMVFFRDIQNHMGLYRDVRRQVVNSLSGNNLYAPAAIPIQQAPVDERQLIELVAYAVIPKSGTIKTRVLAAPPFYQAGRILGIGGYRHLLLSNIYGLPGSSEEEAYSMFRTAATLLQKEQLNFRDVVRTWIHLRHIDRDYSGLNRGRTKFFREQGLASPPASTGIGGTPPFQTRNMCLSLYAIEDAARDVQRMSAPTLNEAWMYGSDFSRGFSVVGKNGLTLFVSGTASVDEKGNTVNIGDFEAQVERMILNISTLLANQNSSFRDVVSAITYLKNPADASCLRKILAQKEMHGFPNALVQAAICRSDLLCEMEAIAVLPLRQS
jgi:enamine deaminase RidA (YjgF/YER057c/UK114 family)